MSPRRHGIKVLGLSLLTALGLMALSATAAQAGEYTLNGSSFTSKGLASESITGTIGSSKFLVPGLSLTFSCTGGSLSGTVLLGGVSHVSTLYSGCSVEGNKFCKTYETKAKMETEVEPGFLAGSGLGELRLMGGNHYLVIIIHIIIYLTKSAKGCTLPLEGLFFGAWIFLHPNALTPLVTQTVNTLTQAELESLFAGEALKYENQTAWIDGATTSVSLSGANKGQKWGAE